MSAPTHIITIKELVELIKNNPKKKEILQLQSLEYGSIEYKKAKKYLPAIKAYGSFSGLKVSQIEKINNYFYFDIDNTTIEPQDIIKKYPFISLITKSVGGKGIFFLVKIDNIDIDIINHTHIHRFLCDNVFMDLNIDRNATGISRNVIIPSYQEVIYQDVSYSIDKDMLVTFIGKVNNVKQVKITGGTEERIQYGLNEPLLLRTKYEGNIDKLYNVEEIEFADIHIPKIIKDGTKHKLYAALVNQIIYLNPTITLEQTISFIAIINKDKGQPPMEYNKLVQLVTWTYNNIINTGEIKARLRKKKIHFNMDKKLAIKDKQIIAAKANGIIRTNTTINKINDAINLLLMNNEKITNNRLAEMTGLSLATIKRNKNKEVKDAMSFNDYVPAADKIKSIEDTLPTFSAEDFWGTDEPLNDTKKTLNEPVKFINYKWKGFKQIELKLTLQDKELFKEMINILINNENGISEGSLIELNMMDKYKIDYFYNKWIKKYGYNDINENILNDK